MKAVTRLRFSCRALISALLSALLLTSCGGGGNGATQSDEPAAADVGRVTALAASQSVSSIRTVVTTLTKVGETRVSRTVYDYVFQISVRNDGDAQAGVVATLTNTGLGTTIIDGGVVIGDIAASALVTPSDTITLRQDRSLPFNTGALVWNIRSVPAVPGFVSVVAADPATAVSINGFLSAPNILLIRFKTGVTPQQMAETIAAAGGSVVGQVPLTMLVQARFDGAWTEARATALISQLAALAVVEGASLDKFTVPNSAPNDPWSGTTLPPGLPKPVWDGRFDTGPNWRIKAMHADGAWERVYGSGRTLHPVTMGVLDHGFAEGHEDLTKLRTVNVPTIELTSRIHGMHVAGIMAASGNNSVGVAGIAGAGDLVPSHHTIFAYDISSGQDSSVEAGIALLSAANVKVINMSFGMPFQDCSRPVTTDKAYLCLPADGDVTKRKLREEALDMFVRLQRANKDVLIVQAAGNTQIDASYSGWAASALWDAGTKSDTDALENRYGRDNLKTIRSKLLVVGAIYPVGSTTLAKASYSNTGRVIEVWAPGGEHQDKCAPVAYCLILSTGLLKWGYWDSDRFGIPEIGTSMAAPHISGLAGLLWQVNPGFSAEQVKNLILLRTVDGIQQSASNIPPGPTGEDYGRGVLVHADNAVKEALRTTNRPPVASIDKSQIDSDFVFNGVSSTDPDGDAIVSYRWALMTEGGFVARSGNGATFRVPQFAAWYTVSLQVTDSFGMPSTTKELRVYLAGSPPPVQPVPSLGGLSPSTMIGDGLSKELSIDGIGFTDGNVVQFRWGVGTGAGVWTNSIGSYSSLNPLRIKVPLNPGKVTDKIDLRVCRTYQQNTDADCSSGVWAVAVTSTLPVGPDLVPQNISLPVTTASPSDAVAVLFDIANQGTGTAAASAAVVRLNQSDVSAAGANLAAIDIPQFAAGGKFAVSAAVAAPLVPGVYRVWVIADNNSTAGQGAGASSNDIVLATSTLTVASTFASSKMTLTATPDPVRPGQLVQYAATVSNRTAAAQTYLITAVVPNGMTVAASAISQVTAALVSGCGGASLCTPGMMIQWGTTSGFPVVIAAGQSVTVTFAALVDATNPLPNGTVVRATAAAAVLGSGSSGGSASAAVDVVVSF